VSQFKDESLDETAAPTSSKRAGIGISAKPFIPGEGKLTASIPVTLLEGWITELQVILKAEVREAKTGTDFSINQGMRHGLDQIQSRLNTWLRHQENIQSLSRSGKKFLITKDIDLSDGRYRKLEWYQGDLFVVLAWRHGKNEEMGELMLELQDTRNLSKIFLVYQGDSSFDELAELARVGGLDSIKTEGNRGEWVEKIWT
jgi:hypothetical protein